MKSTVALASRCSAGASDSPVNYSGAATEKPKAEDSEEQCATVRVRAEPPVRGAPDSEQCVSGVAPDCLVPLEDKAPTVETAQTLTVE